MLRRFILMLMTAWTIMVFGLAAAWGEDMPADNGRAEVINALADLFKSKEVITGEEAAAVKEKIKPPIADGKDLEVLLILLHDKGVVGDEENMEITSRVRNSSIPGRDIEAVVDYLRVLGTLTGEEADGIMDKLAATPLGKEKALYERIMANVTREIRNEVQGTMKKEIKEEAVLEAKSETKKSLPEWLNRISFGGDLRFRYEGDFFDQGNADILSSDGTQLVNTKVDRNRFLLRARLNMTAKVNDEVEAVIGLATGTTSNPVSTNVTLGDYFNKKPINVDLAYMKWAPLPGLTTWGGRIPNPFFSTDLVWDPDLRFDGIAASYAMQYTPRLGVFATVGAFPLQEVEFSSRDKWLFGGQAVLDYNIRQHVSARLGVAFYDYENISGRANDPATPGVNNYTAPLFQQKGNTLFDIDPSASGLKTALASDFRELNVTGTLDLAFWEPVHLVFLADYVKNLGYDSADVARRTSNPFIKEETTGYQLGLALGYPNIRDYGDWKGYFFYKHLEADAVVDGFTDSDFHLGGTNAQGWIVGGDVGLRKNFWLSARWLSADEISGPPIAIDVFQLSLNAKF